MSRPDTFLLLLPVTAAASAGRSLILKGAVLSLANPYFTIWWATIGLGYIMHSLRLGPAAVAAFFTGHILGDLFWYGLVSFTLARGEKAFNGPPLQGDHGGGCGRPDAFCLLFRLLRFGHALGVEVVGQDLLKGQRDVLQIISLLHTAPPFDEMRKTYATQDDN